MKILMVYPEFPDTFWSFKHALRFIRKKAFAPPLGLLTVAAMLPTEAAGRPERHTPDATGPGLGRLRVRQRDDRAARSGARGDCPV